MEKPKTVKLTAGDRTFYILVDAFLVFVFIIVLIPMWSTIAQSFRPNGYMHSYLEAMFRPWEWRLGAYRSLLGNAGFITAFWNSLKILFFGVATALALTVPLAYCMSVQDLPGRKLLNWYVLIPYLFNIGLIPTYLVVTNLGFTDHLASVFIPGAVGTYNCLIMRGFFEGIPESLKESARIDGAAEWYVLIAIILPLSKPILMSIGLFYGVNFWNDFMHPLLYIQNSYLQPLPILLRNILLGASMSEVVEATAFADAPVEAIKAASVFLSAIPMVIAYPFIQKYFTKGTMLGAVKG